ncbi:SPX domain-containing protein [Mycena epipterygia]|nr:SPX domain-containing protein [Mycena epipterygia]
MHFAKTYAQLLLDLPPELRENSIQYRQLKRLINQVVIELSSLGLSPAVLNDLLNSCAEGVETSSTSVAYEFNSDSAHIEPRLRFSVDPLSHGDADSTRTNTFLLSHLQHPETYDAVEPGGKIEIVIPLVSDSAFFRLLAAALQMLANHLIAVHHQFVATLTELTRAVSDSARPVSSTSTAFKAHSVLQTDAGRVRVRASSSKSDLSSWREIFQLYVEAEIFESVNEQNPGERTIEECETRLRQFAERVAARDLDTNKLKLPRSRKAFTSFLELNFFILNVKKFSLANAEATRKILKKHTKRTALPAIDAHSSDPLTSLWPTSNPSLPRILVQELGTMLLPIIPSLEDYSCLICTGIAFKPIRLACGHLFCVRCLVKMQKRGNGSCPMCRTPCVLQADRSNVDWALLNFMRDWFPEEASLKLRQNEREAAEEELLEMGLNPNERCVVT